jgi:predicted TIM-barrel fold metal-dependent hydrolase
MDLRQIRSLALFIVLAVVTPVEVFGQPVTNTNAPPDQLLLKDYRPQSIFKIPATPVEKARFPVIDVHSHVYARTPSQIAQWIQNLDAVGIEKSVVMVSAAGKAFDDAIKLYGPHSNRFEVWCGFDYSSAEEPDFAQRAIAELERCKQAGARGVGELSDKGRGLNKSNATNGPPGLHIDDPRMDPILERCADLGLPVNIHVGEDRWMYEPMDATNDGLMNAFKWRIPDDPNVLRHDDVVATLDRAVSKHPRVTFIACHLANCCSDLSILARMLDAHPNLFADFGARYAEISPIPRYMRRFFDQYQDRLLYGTDMGLDPEMYRVTFRILETADEHFYAAHLAKYHWPLHGFGLPDEILKKIYAENAKRILPKLNPP